MKPILYSFRRCPYAMRARIALSYACIDYSHREISLKNKPQSLLNYSKKGTVPVLIVDEFIIDESLDIMYWALKQCDDNFLLKSGSSKLIELCDSQFKPQLDKYKYSDRCQLTQAHYKQNSLWFLILLEKKLSKKKFILGDEISIADYAIFPFIRQFAYVNINWFNSSVYKNLQLWLAFHLNSQLFQTIMSKHELWND